MQYYISHDSVWYAVVQVYFARSHFSYYWYTDKYCIDMSVTQTQNSCWTWMTEYSKAGLQFFQCLGFYSTIETLPGIELLKSLSRVNFLVSLTIQKLVPSIWVKLCFGIRSCWIFNIFKNIEPFNFFIKT